jgi:chorismate dehydratase
MRIGVVGFTNALPLSRELEKHLPRALIVHTTPATIADDLEAGRMDVGLVPVVTLAQNPSWALVPGLGIASEGPVRSVLLLSRVRLDRIRRLVLDPASRTSNHLARLWFKEKMNQDLEVILGQPDPGGRLEVGDATVVIGDDALFWEGDVEETVDLGGAWTEWTGLPFVFAVWAGPGADAPGLSEAMDACFRENAVRIPDLAAEAARNDSHRRALIESYLTHSIRYRLGERESRGLERYLTLGSQGGYFTTHPDGVVHVHAG